MSVFRTRRLSDHVGRSVTQTVAQSCIIIAFGLMPLGGAVAINFASPLFATLLAALWLKETIGLARGVALIVGFAGVLLVAAPGADSFRIGALFALANAVLYGSVTAAVRGMTTTESAETLTMYQMVFLAIFFALALPFVGFTWPTGADLGALFANGVLNAVGQYWWTRSLSWRRRPRSGRSIISRWSGRSCSASCSGARSRRCAVAGSAIVVGSGLFLLWHESGKKRRARRIEMQEGEQR